MKYLLDGEESERLLFRLIRKSDFDTWLEFHKNPKTSEHWIAELETPKIECEKWYKKQFSDKGLLPCGIATLPPLQCRILQGKPLWTFSCNILYHKITFIEFTIQGIQKEYKLIDFFCNLIGGNKRLQTFSIGHESKNQTFKAVL